MNKINEKLEKINGMGLMTHVIVGYPDMESTQEVIMEMDKCGVEFIELQIPFSDPIADGPTIMKACEISLNAGTKVKDAFILAKNLSSKISSVLLFMAYYNTVFKFGIEKFCREAQIAGVGGLIVPDIPIEEAEEFFKFCKKYELLPIRVVSPASTEERLIKNSKIADGFVYCTARQGTTGARKDIDPNTAKFLKRVKKYFKVPLAVGFGISKKEHIDKLENYADITIVGSAIVEIIRDSNKKNLSKNVNIFINSLRSVVN